jgi:AraC family transcriptional regulator, transcriptional activator FtrA
MIAISDTPATVAVADVSQTAIMVPETRQTGHTVAVAVSDGIPLFGLAVPAAVFGVDRPELVDPWYDFMICAPAGARVGGWLRTDTPHGLEELASAYTVIVPACHDPAERPPDELVDAVP